MIERALIILDGRKPALWASVAAVCAQVRAAGGEVSVAALAPPPDAEGLHGIRLISLSPDRWSPEGVPLASTQVATPARSTAAPVTQSSNAANAAPTTTSVGPRTRARRWLRARTTHQRARRYAKSAWDQFRKSSDAMEAARGTDLIVAMDLVMVRTAWELAQRDAHPSVVLGQAGVDHVLSEQADAR